MSYHVRENLGYTLKDYDPCFNYNADRFCCSKRGQHFRKNILLSDCPTMKSDSYSQPRNYDPNDDRPLWLKVTGLVDPDTYSFTPQERNYTWCSRIPCAVDQKHVPCQSNMPYCNKYGGCGK